MTEAFITGIDAYVHGSVRTGKTKPKRGKLEAPWYVKDPAKVKGLSGAALWSAVDRMMGRLTKGPG